MAKKAKSALGYDNDEETIVVPCAQMEQQIDGKGNPTTEIPQYTVVNLGPLMAMLGKIKKLKEAGIPLDKTTFSGDTILKASSNKELDNKATPQAPNKGFEPGE